MPRSHAGFPVRSVDEAEIEVRCLGLLTDFTSAMCLGSQRLMELADRREALQVEACCWCGERGSMNARTVDGEIQRVGEQVVAADRAPDRSRSRSRSLGGGIAPSP